MKEKEQLKEVISILQKALKNGLRLHIDGSSTEEDSRYGERLLVSGDVLRPFTDKSLQLKMYWLEEKE